MADDSDRPADELAGEPADKKKAMQRRKARKLRSVEGGAVERPGGRRHVPFARGNSFGKFGNISGKRDNPVYQMDAIAKDVISKLRFIRAGKGAKRRAVAMDPARANAIVIALRLRLDVYSQWEAARLLAEARQQVAEFREQVKALKQRLIVA